MAGFDQKTNITKLWHATTVEQTFKHLSS